METLGFLAPWLRGRADAENLALARPRLLSRHDHRRAAGARAFERRGDPDPARLHARPAGDLGADHADQRLLRRHVWRADLLDPAQHPGRRAGGDDDPRRLSDGQAGPGGRGAGAVRRRLVRRQLPRHRRAWSCSRRSWRGSRCCSDRPSISRSTRSPLRRSAASPATTRRKAALAAALGLGIAMIGVDYATGIPRYTFGDMHLYEGIDFLVAIVGLFAISEVLLFIEHQGADAADRDEARAHHRAAQGADRAAAPTMLRSTIVGFFAGMLPGAGASLGSFISYTIEKRIVDREGTFGKGDPARRRRARGRQQCRRGRRAGPDADARRAGQRHDRRAARHADDPQHHPRAAPLSAAAGRGLGPDRRAVHRQRHAADHEHSDGRHVRPGADGAVAHSDAGGGDDRASSASMRSAAASSTCSS